MKLLNLKSNIKEDNNIQAALDDAIRQKLKIAAAYGRSAQDRKYTANNQEEKNQMALAAIFSAEWRKFMSFWGSCTKPEFTIEECQKIVEKLDFIINLINASPGTWELFWQGRQPLDPKRMPFITDTAIEFIDLNQVSEIYIPNMGFKEIEQ